jgi:hypothetical protein
LFEELAVHPRIVVTGPQRSGTRIAAKMIAADTGHRFIDERRFGVFDKRRWREALRAERVVVQAPTMLKEVVDNPPPGIFVVLMRRDLTKIRASANRIGWDKDPRGNALELSRFGLTSGDSAQAKYDYWASREKVMPFLELEYESLRQHPYFIPDDQRRNFGSLQTEL